MKMIYPIIFIAAFILVSGALIFLNSMYKNIFQFDFSPSTQILIAPGSSATSGLLKDSTFDAAKNKALKDSSDVTSRLQTDSTDTEAEIEDITQPELNIVDNVQSTNQSTALTAYTDSRDTLAKREGPDGSAKVDTVYVQWIKATAAMYESMDPKKAAKIIQNYPEKIARDIIYKMKKKKAAEVLAELDPVVANRITEYW